MLLQHLRALCLASRGPGSIWNYLGAPARLAGVSGRFACGFRTVLHFADGEGEKEHEHASPTPGEDLDVKTSILDDDVTAERAAHSAGQERRKPKWERGSEYGRRMDRTLMMAQWEQQQCAYAEMNGGPTIIIYALDICRSMMPNCGPSDSSSVRQS